MAILFLPQPQHHTQHNGCNYNTTTATLHMAQWLRHPMQRNNCDTAHSAMTTTPPTMQPLQPQHHMRRKDSNPTLHTAQRRQQRHPTQHNNRNHDTLHGTATATTTPYMVQQL